MRKENSYSIMAYIKEEDLENRYWLHLDEAGELLFDLGGIWIRASEGKGEYSFTHNCFKFWLLYLALPRYSWEVLEYYYSLFSRYEDLELDLASMFLKVCGVLPWSSSLKIGKTLVLGERKLIFM